MRILLVGALALCATLSAAACGGVAITTGPRPAGAMSRAFVNGAELKMVYRFDPTSAGQLDLFVDVTAVSGDAGEVAIELEPEGFEVVGSPSSWTLAVPAGKTESRHSTLRVLGTTTPTVTIVTTRLQGTVEIARDTIRFVVRDMTLRECQTEDPSCAEPAP